MKKNQKKNSGYAILETLFYVALLVALSLVAINSMITMVKAFKETRIHSQLVQAGNILERISREVRQANSIDVTSTSTDLKLNSKDSEGVDKTIEFKLVGINLEIWENGNKTGNLNAENISVSGVTFTQITTVVGKAVKISLQIFSENDSSARIVDYYTTAVLRGSY